MANTSSPRLVEIFSHRWQSSFKSISWLHFSILLSSVDTSYAFWKPIDWTLLDFCCVEGRQVTELDISSRITAEMIISRLRVCGMTQKNKNYYWLLSNFIIRIKITGRSQSFWDLDPYSIDHCTFSSPNWSCSKSVDSQSSKVYSLARLISKVFSSAVRNRDSLLRSEFISKETKTHVLNQPKSR